MIFSGFPIVDRARAGEDVSHHWSQHGRHLDLHHVRLLLSVHRNDHPLLRRHLRLRHHLPPPVSRPPAVASETRNANAADERPSYLHHPRRVRQRHRAVLFLLSQLICKNVERNDKVKGGQDKFAKICTVAANVL